MHSILFLEETSYDDDVHLHEDIPTTIIMDSKEDKGLVSYAPFQNSEFDDESIDDLKRIELVEKPLEEQEFAMYFPLSSCDKQHGSQEDDDVGTLFVIGRHRWDVDH
jgi:hypothetical protein